MFSSVRIKHPGRVLQRCEKGNPTYKQSDRRSSEIIPGNLNVEKYHETALYENSKNKFQQEAGNYSAFCWNVYIS